MTGGLVCSSVDGSVTGKGSVIGKGSAILQTTHCKNTDSLASVTGEALWMIGVSQRCDNSALHILPTNLALGAKLNVVVTATIVVVILHKVTSRG